MRINARKLVLPQRLTAISEVGQRGRQEDHDDAGQTRDHDRLYAALLHNTEQGDQLDNVAAAMARGQPRQVPVGPKSEPALSRAIDGERRALPWKAARRFACSGWR